MLRSDPKGRRDLLPPHFVRPRCDSSFNMLHPFLKTKWLPRAPSFFKSHFFFSRISRCFLISPSSSPISLFFSLLIPIKAHWLGLDSFPPLFLPCCSFLFLLYTFLSLFGYSTGSEEWRCGVTCASPEAKDVFDKYLHFHLDRRVRGHKLDIIYSDIKIVSKSLFFFPWNKVKVLTRLQKEQ